jgi:uncharacterized membrane protein/protein-disulfide isomerase
MLRPLADHENKLRPVSSWPGWRLAFTGLSALGLALSGYLSWHYLLGGSMIGCDGGSACDQVLTSRWATIGGVLPISGLAAGTYLSLLIASFFLGPATEAPVRRLAWRAILILAGAAMGSAIWFISLQKWAIGTFCPYCLATHITGLLLAAVILWQTPHNFFTRRKTLGTLLIGLFLAGIMAFGQVVIKTPARYRSGEAQNLPLIDPHAAPVIGSPDAPYRVTLLFDYQCPHCQELHFMLAEAVRRYGGKLAFIQCPTPLNTDCNPYIPRDVPEFKGSCELAKTALAVWVAQRAAFPAFDNWMFSLDSGDHWQPRSLAAAQARAIEMVGPEKFNTALNSPWINQYLQASIHVYGQTLAGGNAVPKMVFNSHWVIPQPNDADDLISILQNQLGVPKP